MANTTINIPRTHLIMGLCLPLAVLVGYFLAQPLESGSIAVVVLVLSIICVPLFMKWHHPLLVVSWNAAANPLFLPGRPYLWMLVAVISFFFAVLNRSVNANRKFIHVPSITKPLLFFTVVVVATALLTGGMGIRSLGSERYGGRGYFYILIAVCGYFALTSHQIPKEKAGLYIGMFFLSGLTAMIGDIAFAAGPQFSFVWSVFVPESGIEQMVEGVNSTPGSIRLGSLPTAAVALYGWLFARYGIQGVLELRRPWRLFLLIVAAMACLLSGYRSSLILLIMVFTSVFWFEGLFRTRFLPTMLGILLVAAALAIPQAQKLPLMAQRALSFLPGVQFDPLAKESAEASTEWRVDMWKQVLPQIPKYLIKGKGYALDPNDLFMAQQSAYRGFAASAGALVAGDYHNGPLSLVIPFGIFGLVAFMWLLVAGCRLLLYYQRFGDPTLRRINTFLLAIFVSRAVFFFFVFGAVSADLFHFLGLLGLSVSLNGAPGTAVKLEETQQALTLFPQRIY